MSLKIITEQGVVEVPMHVEAQGGKAIDAYVAAAQAAQSEAAPHDELNGGQSPAEQQ